MRNLNGTASPVEARTVAAASLAREKGALLILLMAVTTLMTVLTTAEGAFYRAGRGDEIALASLAGGRLIDWYTCAVLIPPLFWVTCRWPIERGRWILGVAVHLGASLCAVLLKYLIYVPLRSLIEANYQVGVIEAISADFLGKLMFFWAAIGMLHAIFFYRRYQAHSGVAAELASPLNHAKQASRADGISACADNVFPFVANAQIEWIEAQGNYVLIHAGERRHLVRETMVAVSAKLDPSRFVRVHRSAIVNVAAVSYVEPAAKGRYRLTLRNGESLSTGRSFRARARGLLR